jgi:oligopeptide/dipeptide ABC transporter ATP-binding protein
VGDRVNALLETRDLSVRFGQSRPAVDSLSYRLDAGRTLAVIGESGAGKSVSCLALVGLLPDKAVVAGSVRFEGRELLGLSEREMRAYRGKRIAFAFQDAGRALNPTIRVGEQIAEAVREHHGLGRRAALSRAAELLEQLKVSAPKARCYAYPHELSGGMRQRAIVAIALAGSPQLLIADEATRSLDRPAQIRLLALLKDVQQQTRMAIMLVSHDLALTARFADETLVMYSGRPVEHAPSQRLFAAPRMPYTKALLNCAVDYAPWKPRVAAVSPATVGGDFTGGCNLVRFCSRSRLLCSQARPHLEEKEPGHRMACWYPHERETP